MACGLDPDDLQTHELVRFEAAQAFDPESAYAIAFANRPFTDDLELEKRWDRFSDVFHRSMIAVSVGAVRSDEGHVTIADFARWADAAEIALPDWFPVSTKKGNRKARPKLGRRSNGQPEPQTARRPP